MPKITFLKPFAPLDVKEGANLMQALLGAGMPVASSCYGDGVCGKCRLDIPAGQGNLTPPTDLEEMARARLRIPKEIRLSCQCEVKGDVTVDATYW
jgi:ferredoxin, 2Fe-2S